MIPSSTPTRERLAAEFRQRLRRMSYLPVWILLALALLMAGAANRVLDRARWVDHTHQVLGRAHRCLLLTLELDLGVREFLVTGAEAPLEAYREARRRIDAEWVMLEESVSDNASQQARARILRERARAYVEGADQAIGRRGAAEDPSGALFAQESGRHFDAMRRDFLVFAEAEEALLEERSAAFHRTGAVVLALRFASALGCAILLAFLIRGHLRRLQRSYDAALDDAQRSAGTLAVTLRSIGDGVITTDLEGRVNFLNPVAEQLTGWRGGEAGGRPVEEVFRIVSESTGAAEESPVAKVLRDRRVVAMANHTALVRRDGTRRSIADSGAPILGDDGAMMGVVMVFRDVTEARHAEAEREKLVKVVEHSSDCIAMASFDGRVLYLNAAGRRLVGLREDEDYRGYRLTDYVPEPWLAFFNDSVLPEIREKGAWRGEMRLRNRASGELIDVERSMFVVRDPRTDEPVCIASVTRDVTEQRRAARALRESEERHRLAIEASGLGTWDWEWPAGRLEWDARCRAIFGLGADTPLSYELFLSRIWPEDRARVDAAVKRALTPEAEGRYEQECRVLGPGDDLRWVRSRGLVFFNPDGSPARMTGTAFDVTHERRQQEELERRVAERTQALTEANERLKEVDRLKSQFLASMSHELRTPLNSIIGFTEIVVAGLAGPLNEEQQKQLRMSLASSRHLLTLINDLLDLARIESGRATPRPSRFDLRSVLDDVVNSLTPLAAKKSLGLRVEAEGPTEMCSDRKMVYQIVLNLAGNAVKFTERGQVRIACAQDGERVRVVVVDTGIGIRPEDLRLVFEAFRQVDGSSRRRFEGTGLGLHLSQRLAGLLGGEIVAESRFGEGSAFTLTLPAELVPAGPPSPFLRPAPT